MVELEQAVSVLYPEMRARLRRAVDEMCDTDLQQRLWLRDWAPTDPPILGFDDALLVVIDEMEMFGTPPDLVGDVLVDQTEEVAFNALVSAIEDMIAAIGGEGSFSEALTSGTWEPCVAAACEMQRRMATARGSGSPPASGF